MVKKLIILVVLVLLLGGAYFFWRKDGGLYRDFEGLYLDYNFRDVGESLNACLLAQDPTSKPLFQNKILARANRHFSGWSCEGVNNPDKLYSFNFDPKEGMRYYCKRANGKLLVGEFNNANFEYNRIENLKNWRDPSFTLALCPTIRSILQDMANHRHVLLHCEAGRDRTGAMSALLSFLLLENYELDTPQTLQAIECDYQKTEGLAERKKGKMRKFIKRIRKSHGTAFAFLQKKCGLSKEEVHLAAEAFITQEAKKVSR